MTQTRQSRKVCSKEGHTLLAQFEYLGELCGEEESKELFGVDATFSPTSSVFTELSEEDQNCPCIDVSQQLKTSSQFDPEARVHACMRPCTHTHPHARMHTHAHAFSAHA